MTHRYRTHACGSLRAANVGETVVVSGFVGRRRDHGGLVFIDLRDREGAVQIVVDPSSSARAAEAAEGLRLESVVRVAGPVVARSVETVNPRLPSGEVEVAAVELEVLSPADVLPFQLDDDGVDEALRIRYRALDLRRDEMRRAIETRFRVTSVMRRYLEDRGFWELETPVLGKSTPEGARDFLVPARMAPGSFYALPQSPQMYKQIYQMAGIERYYQIARCFRDEAQRADRQLEFTQLDLEMSYVEREDVLSLVEGLYREIWRQVKGVELDPEPFPRMPHGEALLRFGTDKPDLRYEMEIADVSGIVRESGFVVFSGALASGGVVRALACPGAAGMSRRELDELAAFAREWGGKGLAYLLFDESGAVRSPIAKFLSTDEVDAIRQATGASAGDAVFIAADTAAAVVRVLGALRPHLARRFSLIDESRDAMLFVVDFPLFEWSEDDQRWEASHHMFTAPKEEHEALLDSDPGAVVSEAYDFVVNGYELASGSLRINRADLQQKIFDTVGFSREDAEDRFGFLLRQLRNGAPPHGGIAPGLDRTVMILCGTDNIRDVIAFPKIAGGLDPLSGAPSKVDAAQMDDLGLAIRAKTQP